MGYAHGTQWTDEMVISEIMGMIDVLGLKSFPTHKQMEDHFGNASLVCKISKSGGTRYWAEKVGMPIKKCESELGNDLELCCMEKLIFLGYDCEQMKPRFPYDILVNKHIKVDVKSAFRFDNYGRSKYFSFNLEKSNPTCDIYVFFCLNADKSIFKNLIVPSCFLQGNTQVGIGISSKKYDKFIDRWDYFQKYDNFYKSIMGE